jgi:copper chaperone CopZ
VKTLAVSIDGMHCDGCAETIKALLTLETGVKAVNVSYPERRAHVLYDPAAIDEVKLVAAIQKGGYKVTAVS